MAEHDEHERRRQAQQALADAAVELAGAVGVKWSPPGRRWDLDSWRHELLTSCAGLMHQAAQTLKNVEIAGGDAGGKRKRG